jgi:hypothetical protein
VITMIITSDRQRRSAGRDPNLGCGRPLRPGDAWTCDRIQAVINDGPNCERNLHPLCEWCEPPKTEADVHDKSRLAQAAAPRGHQAGAKGAAFAGHLCQRVETSDGWRMGAEGAGHPEHFQPRRRVIGRIPQPGISACSLITRCEYLGVTT